MSEQNNFRNSTVDEAELLQEALESGAWHMEFNQRGELVGVHWSQVFRHMVGFKDEVDFPDKLSSFEQILLEDDRKRVITHLWNAIQDYTNRSPYDIEYRIRTKHRGVRWFHAAGRLARREDGSPISIVGFFIDIDDKKKAEAQLEANNKALLEQLHTLQSLASMYFSMHLINLVTGELKEFSAEAPIRPYLSYQGSAAEKMRNVMSNVVVPEYRRNCLEFTDLNTLSQRMKGLKTMSSEFVGKHTGWFIANFITVEADRDGYPTVVLFTTQVIDETKQKEHVLFLRSVTDEMTGFLNRRAYEEELEYYRHNTIKDDMVFVSFDLNGLKHVNDTLGHIAGDELLRGYASILKGMAGQYGRRAKGFRIGGDEFIVIVHLTEERFMEAEKVFLERVGQWHGQYVSELSISYGIAFRSHHLDLSIDEMAALADKRMYQHKADYYKESGRDRRNT